jgi:hypothetical protein
LQTIGSRADERLCAMRTGRGAERGGRRPDEGERLRSGIGADAFFDVGIGADVAIGAEAPPTQWLEFAEARSSWTGQQKSRLRAGFLRESIGRGDRIRTCDLYVPNVALYQTELHPDIAAEHSRDSAFTRQPQRRFRSGGRASGRSVRPIGARVSGPSSRRRIKHLRDRWMSCASLRRVSADCIGVALN